MLSRGILAHASNFYQANCKDPGTKATYGYFTHHPVAPVNKKRLEVILEILEALSPHRMSLPVLDIACGGGLIASAMAAKGHRVAGLDIDATELRLARAFADSMRIDNVRFLYADVVNSISWHGEVEEYLGERPRVVTLAYALHHLPKVQDFIRSLSAWLPDGAVVIVNEENPLSPLFQTKHLIRTVVQKDTDVEWHRKPQEWMAMFDASGMKLQGPVRGVDMLPVLPRVSPNLCWSVTFSVQKSL